jgi:hypothetical protein
MMSSVAYEARGRRDYLQKMAPAVFAWRAWRAWDDYDEPERAPSSRPVYAGHPVNLREKLFEYEPPAA